MTELARVGPDAELHTFELAEQFLVRAAQVEAPAALARSAKWVLAQLDPAGLEPIERAAERGRTFTVTERADADGLVTAKGRLDAETAAALRTVLDALAAPRSTNDAGVRDERGPGQRQHDALLEMALRLLRSGELPDCGGVTTSVIVQLRGAAGLDDGALAIGAAALCDDVAPDDASAADRVEPMGGRAGGLGSLLTRLSGVGQFGDGGLVSVNRARPLFDECEITAVVLSATGGVLDYGRDRRVATPAMRRALAARDGGCCFPGCSRPPTWCEAHHVWAWIDGGPTSLGNLCLLCAYHHRSFAAAGWRVLMRDGVPVWLPPAWLDPQQQPLRNETRQLSEIDFGRGVDVVMRT